MRVLEALLLCFCIWGLAYKAVNGHIWNAYGALVLIVAAIQVRGERPTWRLAPMYLVTVSLWYQSFRGLLYASVWPDVLQLGLLLVSAVSASLFPVFALPRPQGPHRSVGHTTVFVSDDGRTSKAYDPEDQGPRDLVASIWYPAVQTRRLLGSRRRRTTFLPVHDHSHPRMSQFLNVPRLLASFLLSHWGQVETRAYENLAPDEQQRCPVLLYSHALGGFRTQNTSLCVHFASMGFIVIAVDHPYDCSLFHTPDGRYIAPRVSLPPGIEAKTPQEQETREAQLQLRTGDVLAVLRQLERAGKLSQAQLEKHFDTRLRGVTEVLRPLAKMMDCDKLATAGMSFGAATSVMVAVKEPRVRAVIALDPWFLALPKDLYNDRAGLDPPMMVIRSDLWQWQENIARIERLIALNAARKRRALHYVYKGTRHHNFNDIGLAFPSLARRFKAIGPSEPFRCLYALSMLSSLFVSTAVHVGSPDAVVEQRAGRMPELVKQPVQSNAPNPWQ